MWKALRGRRRAVRGRAGAGGLRKGEGGDVGLLPLERDPILVLLFPFPTHPITPNREMPRVAEPPSLLPGSGTMMSDNGWGGTDQPHSNGEKNGRARTGHSSEPPLLSLAKPPRLGPSRDTAAPAPPKFPISIARPGRLSLPFLFFLCAASTYYTNTPVLLRSWFFGTIMDIVASVVVQSKHIAKLASFTSQSTEKHPPRARWWY